MTHGRSKIMTHIQVAHQFLKTLENEISKVVWIFEDREFVFDSLSCFRSLDLKNKKNELTIKYIEKKNKNHPWYVDFEYDENYFKNYENKKMMRDISKLLFKNIVCDIVRGMEWKYQDQKWEVSDVQFKDLMYNEKDYLCINFKNNNNEEFDIDIKILDSWFLEHKTPWFSKKLDIIKQIIIEFNARVRYYELNKYLKNSQKIGNEKFKFDNICGSSKHIYELIFYDHNGREIILYIHFNEPLENKEKIEGLIQNKFLEFYDLEKYLKESKKLGNEIWKFNSLDICYTTISVEFYNLELDKTSDISIKKSSPYDTKEIENLIQEKFINLIQNK